MRALILVSVLVLSVPALCAGAEMPARETIVRAVMNESANQGPEGMLAHAWMFRNRIRAGMPLGSSGLYSARVSRRLAREAAATWTGAREAVALAFAGAADPTRGAVYCENVKAFGVPAHIKRLRARGEIVSEVTIKDVTFWSLTIQYSGLDYTALYKE